MHQTAQEADLDPHRLSFTYAVEVLDTACSEFALVVQKEFLQLQERLLADLRESATLLPPRVVKRAYSSFHLKRPRQQALTLKKRIFRDILLIYMALTPSHTFCSPYRCNLKITLE
jgi:hypothetical protein